MLRASFMLLVCMSLAGCTSNAGEPRGSVAAPGDSSVRDTSSREIRRDVEMVLDAVLDHALKSRELRGARNFYGTQGQANVVLVVDSELQWPKGYVPRVKDFGFSYVDSRVEVDAESPRRLGIELVRCELPPNGDEVKIKLFNVGGNPGREQVIGACNVRYEIKKTHKGWEVEYLGQLDP